MQNTALNSSLGLAIGSGNNGMVLPMQGVQPSVMPNSPLSNPGMGATSLQRGSVMPGFQPASGLSVMTGGSSLFMGQSSNPMQSSSDLQMPNHGGQANLYPMHGLQHSSPQTSFGSIYGSLIPPPPAQSAQAPHNPADQWYYEDPKKIIQGPFSSKEMFNWYRAGFFSPSLMIRRACDAHMRPLGSYGPIVPFAQMDILSPFPMSSGFDTRSQGPHDLLNPQQGLGLDDALWSQPAPTPDLVWVQQSMNARSESRVNSLPLFFWDTQPSAITSNSLLPEEIAKEMKTEDQILAQLRASQNTSTSQSIPFISDQTSVSTSVNSKTDEAFPPTVSATPNLEELQKLIQTDALASPTPPATVTESEVENGESEQKRSVESSPSKSKKEDKQHKKELEKERKEWVKEGFTIVKGSEKNTKDTKKKVEDSKTNEDADRKRKEEEKNSADEKKEKKNTEKPKNQQDVLQRQNESMSKKAPWSAAATQAQATLNDMPLTEIQRLEREKKLEQMKVQQQMMQIIAQQQAAAMAREQEMQAGLGWAKKKGTNPNIVEQSLTEIQAEARRQSAAAAAAAAAQAFEEAQAVVQQPINVPWATAANASGFWDAHPQKVGDKPQEKVVEPIKNIKKKAVPVLPPPVIIPKKETTPTPEVEFETWCTSNLNLWSTKIDVPTFIGFLKDIESPYEVKDYVKFYLGESKDAYDFARQFLERRSKLLRVGMVTPSDDLCSPALAITPRNPSGSDYQEGKGKKNKKNKMLKVDARILGFSVTAAEDRINVGDIDTA
ncbi:unnamed protein product, partial [Iphiclides podalirius]